MPYMLLVDLHQWIKTSLTGSKSDYPKVATGFLMVKPRSAMRGFFLPKNNFSMEYKRLFAPS